MLQLTENATSVIHQIVDTAELPEGAGVRIAAAGEPGSLADRGGPDARGGRSGRPGPRRPRFLDSVIVPLLDGQTLDAGVDEHGRVSFQLEAQPA